MAVDTSNWIEEAKLPMVMSATIPRVNADGTPTKWMIDWEEQTRNWYKTNAANTKQALVEVSDTLYDPITGLEATAHGVDNLSVAVGLDTSGPFAVATKITSLEVDVGKVSADGEIYFGVAATPAGAVAAYELKLTAGDASTGFKAMAISGGGSAIGMRADQFVFTDAGSMTDVFTYAGGLFVLTGNVAVDGNLVVSGTIGTGKITDAAVTTDKVLDNAISNVATGASVTTGGAASASIYARSGDRVLVWANYTPDGAAGGGSPVIGRIRINNNAGTEEEVIVPNRLSSFNVTNDGTVTDQVYQAETVTRPVLFIAPSTGNHTISGSGVFGTLCYLVCMSLSK